MSGFADYDALRRAMKGRHLPALVCDLDAFDENLRSLVTRAGGRPIRVASKSVRCRALLERALAHEGFAGVMCFSGAEAAFLAAHGIDDLLVAYPSVDIPDLERVCDAVAAGARLVCMVDDRRQVDILAAVARRRDVELPLCLDLDMSSAYPGVWFGVRRSPVRDASAALEVASAVDAASHLRLEGVMGYEAQLAGLGDRGGPSLRAAVIRRLKRRSCGEVLARRKVVVQRLRDAGYALPLVNGGGTGSLEDTAADQSVTEVTAGSGLFSPRLFDHYDAFQHRPSLLFALPVTRRPTPEIVTCHGGGYIASGPAGNDRLPEVFLPAGGRLLPDEGAGEVQTPVQLDGAGALDVGDPIFFRHPKAGEVCERFATILLMSGGEIVDEVPTYRGEGQTFL